MALYGIKDCANLTLFDLATGVPALFSDYANVSTNEWKSDRTYATTKGTRAIAWDSNLQGTLQVEMEVFDLKWLAITAGAEIVEGESDVAKREVATVASSKFTLAGTPEANSIQVIGLASDEIEHVGEPLEEIPYVDGTTTVATGQFAINGQDIIFSSDVIDGTPFAVYYVVLDTNVKTITISADKFPKAYKVVADALIREKESGQDSFVQIEYPNARPQGNFTVTMDSANPTKLQITFDLFPNKDKAIAEYKIIND